MCRLLLNSEIGRAGAVSFFHPCAGSLHRIKSKSSVKINITAIGQSAGVCQIIGGGVEHLCRFGLDFGLGKRADFGGDGLALPHGEIIG